MFGNPFLLIGPSQATFYRKPKALCLVWPMAIRDRGEVLWTWLWNSDINKPLANKVLLDRRRHFWTCNPDIRHFRQTPRQWQHRLQLHPQSHHRSLLLLRPEQCSLTNLQCSISAVKLQKDNFTWNNRNT